MLPGVELARKRRVHQSSARGPPPELSSSTSSSSQRIPTSLRQPLSTAMGPSALAARLRLEEKLRSLVGSQRSSLSSSSSSSSGSSRGAGFAYARRSTPETRTEGGGGVGGSKRESSSNRVLRRTGSRIDVCPVCLDDFRAEQRVTWLPCCHKYHTDCVMPWIAAHSHCPCCRTRVPSLDQLPPPPPLLL